MNRHAWINCDAFRSRWLVVVAVVTLTLCSATSSRARAAGLVDQAHSLKSVPADVALYSASLRLKEQLDIFLASNTYRRMMEIPIVQMGKMQAIFRWQQSQQPAIARFRAYFDSAEGQETLALLKEMFAEESFTYANQDVAGLVQLFMELNNLNRTAKLEALATGETEQEVMQRKAMELLSERAEKFVVPDIVWGFRIKDAARAKKHIDRLQEVLVGLLKDEQPQLAERLKREQIDGNEFLTMRLDGSMIPWGRLRDEAENMTDEQFNKWRDLLNKKTMALAVGVVGEFALFSIGDSTDHLTKLGEGPTLAEQPLMARLAKHADQRVTSIGYVSKSLMKSLNSPQQTIDDLLGSAEDALQQLDVAAELKAQLVEELKGLGDDLVKYMPEPGEVAGISFLTPRGYESFQYQTGTRPTQDSSDVLTVVDHVGGDPMLMIATRTKQSVEEYDQTITWLKRVAAQVELIAKEKTDPDRWAEYLEFREKAVPLLDRLNAATREHMMPALADGQQAFVMDAAATSQQWIELMPKSPQPLPMLELGLVANVSNAQQLRKGVSEYFSVIQEFIGLLHEMHPDQVPDFQIPAPMTRELPDGGTMYTYMLPGKWGVDSQVAPNVALTDSAAAASSMPAMSERLLRTMPLKIDTSLDVRRPAATVSYFEFARLIEAIKPWVSYGGQIAMGQIKLEDDDDDPSEQTPEEAQAMMWAGMVLPQIDQCLDVAAAMRSFSNIVYHEDGAWVTHGEVHFQDLK
jgi:hypothetical protein